MTLNDHPFKNAKSYHGITSSWLSFGGSWMIFLLEGSKLWLIYWWVLNDQIIEYSQTRQRLIQNFSTMLFTKLYLGVNCLILFTSYSYNNLLKHLLLNHNNPNQLVLKKFKLIPELLSKRKITFCQFMSTAYCKWEITTFWLSTVRPLKIFFPTKSGQAY